MHIPSAIDIVGRFQYRKDRQMILLVFKLPRGLADEAGQLLNKTLGTELSTKRHRLTIYNQVFLKNLLEECLDDLVIRRDEAQDVLRVLREPDETIRMHKFYWCMTKHGPLT